MEKPSRALERQVQDMERKNRTYTLLEDSDSDGVTQERGKEKKGREKVKGKKRKHLRQKQEDSSSSSEDEKKMLVYFNQLFLKYFFCLKETLQFSDVCGVRLRGHCSTADHTMGNHPISAWSISSIAKYCHLYLKSNIMNY